MFFPGPAVTSFLIFVPSVDASPTLLVSRR